MSSTQASSLWPREVRSAGNAGILVVGVSDQSGAKIPAVLLGGRFYSGRREYRYTDFGGGVERSRKESPHLAACREFVEELFGLATTDDVSSAASRLSAAIATGPNLCGGRPFVHRGNYCMFVVPAEVIVDALGLRGGATSESSCALDVLFSLATPNSELTSVAIVSIQEMLERATLAGGDTVQALSVRQLVDVVHTTHTTTAAGNSIVGLRHVMVGPGGSINTGFAALEGYSAAAHEEHSPSKTSSETAVGGISEQARRRGEAQETAGSTSTSSDAERGRWKHGTQDPVEMACDGAAGAARVQDVFLKDAGGAAQPTRARAVEMSLVKSDVSGVAKNKRRWNRCEEKYVDGEAAEKTCATIVGPGD